MDIKKALQQLADGIKVEIMKGLRQHGLNERAGFNTLLDSNLARSIQVNTNGTDMLTFSIAEYYIYVVSGRRKGARRPPIEAILKWIREKGIDTSWAKTENQAAWAIAKSIQERGIKARAFIQYDEGEDVAKILPFLDNFFDIWADNVFNDIMQVIDVYFNGK